VKVSYIERRKAVKAYWRELETRKTGLKIPNKKDWMRAVRSGLDSDGCTLCRDHIWGVRIGRSGTDYANAFLPCCCHDYYWHKGGGEKEFEASNVFFYQMLCKKVSKLPWPLRVFAKSRCGLIFQAVSSPVARHRFNWRS
jgi:hypothetical protein